jgi:hypothetical protein
VALSGQASLVPQQYETHLVFRLFQEVLVDQVSLGSIQGSPTPPRSLLSPGSTLSSPRQIFCSNHKVLRGNFQYNFQVLMEVLVLAELGVAPVLVQVLVQVWVLVWVQV